MGEAADAAKAIDGDASFFKGGSAAAFARAANGGDGGAGEIELCDTREIEDDVFAGAVLEAGEIGTESSGTFLWERVDHPVAVALSGDEAARFSGRRGAWKFLSAALRGVFGNGRRRAAREGED